MSGPARPLGRPDEPLEPARGVRVVLDARPLQEPDRAPATAAYLEGLLAAYDADPLEGESFALFLQSDLDDPTTRFERLSVVGRRLLPPTRLLRSAAMTVDPFLLRGAALGAAWRADRAGATGAVYHAAGGSTLPLASGLPVVVTLLDLAPWEMPGAFQRTPATRFGQRIRGRLLHHADALIVGTESVRDAARRLLRVRRDRIRVIPFAPRDWFGLDGLDGADERARLGLPQRYLVYAGRYDARQDLATLLRALAELASAGRPAGLAAEVAWPPRLLLIGASPDDRAALARAAAREGVGDALAYAPHLPDARLAALVRGARAAVLPVLSEAAGLPAIDALAVGTPVVASAVGALPELVGGAGILVPPREPQRLAAALHTVWTDRRVHDRISDEARTRAAARWTWAEVADATRRVYAEVGAYGD
jgi:glycosyltransferase involved in cell wall biosynthesis